ncbi:accessory Sec system protein Asp2 [Staphylococcus canis]|uniref:Accessory Sec system protein Asp2 n=1 Tax=Staphylococcus canis TaxID=2724942 RepID=A0ABS0TA26_9STAP|nr:accessory Sec system protein Asp2 [Staphylococcus canis]MBI5975600.1 accessory Sec system protein Asp2 [Staphylococcus canis]
MVRKIKKYKVLQIGGENFQPQLANPQDVKWNYIDIDTIHGLAEEGRAFESETKINGKYDMIYIEAPHSTMLMRVLERIALPFNTFIDEGYWDASYQSEEVVEQRIIRPLTYRTYEEKSEKIQALTFSGQYGDKVSPKHGIVNRSFSGDARYIGNHQLKLEGHFGEVLQPIVTWQNHLYYDEHKVIQIWPEYQTTGTVEVQYTFRLLSTDPASHVIDTYVLNEAELTEPLEIPIHDQNANITISVSAKGEGTLTLGAVHKRWSRIEMGQFIFGGKRYADSTRDELIYYFDPGDMKPPLNVYFSGYRSAEGFEGFFMMRHFNAPFILIGDPRIEGGAFYLGSDDYEAQIQSVIQNALKKLNFKSNELILSGLSMGSFGALYYGAKLNPSAIIVGKPLINIGTVADNMRLRRPEDFGTALDVLLKNEKSLSASAITRLNKRFWDVFGQADMSQTTFAIAHMEDDDYDLYAYEMLLPILSKQHARVMSRGVPGRHNDDSPTITSWFINFYNIILESQFGREPHDI